VAQIGGARWGSRIEFMAQNGAWHACRAGPAPVDESVVTALAGFARSPRSLKTNQLSFVGRDPATETCP
jgi:hypothetical protein